MNKRLRELVDTFCEQAIKGANDIEDICDIMEHVKNELGSVKYSLTAGFKQKIAKTRPNWVDFFEGADFEIKQRSDFVRICWKHCNIYLTIDRNGVFARREYSNNYREMLSFDLDKGVVEDPPKDKDLKYRVEFVQRHAAEFKELLKLAYSFYQPRWMNTYRATVILILCARKFGQSDFSRFPTDVVKIIAKLVWQARFE